MEKTKSTYIMFFGKIKSKVTNVINTNLGSNIHI